MTLLHADFRFLKLRDDPEKLAEEVKSFEASVANFEKFLEIHGDASGPFLCGEDFSFAEAMMAPFVQRCIPNLLHFVDVDCMAMVRRHPRVEALVTAILARGQRLSSRLRPQNIHVVAAAAPRPLAHGISASSPRRRRDPCPAEYPRRRRGGAATRGISTSSPRRRRDPARGISASSPRWRRDPCLAEYPHCRRGVAATARPRNINVVAAAAPRPVPPAGAAQRHCDRRRGGRDDQVDGIHARSLHLRVRRRTPSVTTTAPPLGRRPTSRRDASLSL